MSGKVALVTGSSRGLGRGIARALGSRGMTVYLTGRAVELLESAADEVSAAGGRGIAVGCDHGDDTEVEQLFARIGDDAGKLDLLVNNAAAVYPQELSAPGPFWKKDIRLADMINVGLRSHYTASFHAMPLLLNADQGLIANISFYGAASYFHGPAYGAAKAGTDKMVHDMGVDLADTPVSVVSLWPGFVLTDMIKALPDTHRTPQLVAMLPDFETPEFSGHVIAALLDDPTLKMRSGKSYIGARLGAEYGIRDLDGKQPRDWSDKYGEPLQFFTPHA